MFYFEHISTVLDVCMIVHFVNEDPIQHEWPTIISVGSGLLNIEGKSGTDREINVLGWAGCMQQV